MIVQVIERNGKPKWAVMPYEDYLRLVEQAEMLEDIQEFDRIEVAVETGAEELTPDAVVNALLIGQSPVKVWREFRQMTHEQLAEAVGISVQHLSRIETKKRMPTIRVMRKIAKALQVAVDDLIETDGKT